MQLSIFYDSNENVVPTQNNVQDTGKIFMCFTKIVHEFYKIIYRIPKKPCIYFAKLHNCGGKKCSSISWKMFLTFSKNIYIQKQCMPIFQKMFHTIQRYFYDIEKLTLSKYFVHFKNNVYGTYEKCSHVQPELIIFASCIWKNQKYSKNNKRV